MTDPSRLSYLDSIESLPELVDCIESWIAWVDKLETSLAKVRADLGYLKEVVGPRLMLELGQISTELEGGIKVRMSLRSYARLVVEKHKEAAQWLTAKGSAGIATGQVGVPLINHTVDELAALAEELGGTFGVKIHPSTLSSCIKQLEAAGEEIPEDLFHIHRKTQVTITRPKGAR